MFSSETKEDRHRHDESFANSEFVSSLGLSIRDHRSTHFDGVLRQSLTKNRQDLDNTWQDNNVVFDTSVYHAMS